MLHQPLAALVGQMVFLKAAVGLVEGGHLDQAVVQGRFEVAPLGPAMIQQVGRIKFLPFPTALPA
jgi:hypothetical protein